MNLFAEDYTPLPLLEIEMRVAQLGGWEKVDMLSYHTDVGSELRWFPMLEHKVAVGAILRAEPHWAIYDIREHQDGT